MSDPATPTPGTDFWEQPATEQELSTDASTITVRYAGDYAAVKTYRNSFAVGDAHPTEAGYELSNIRLERYEGPSGRLILTYSDTAADAEGSGGGRAAREKKTEWSLTSVSGLVPIWRYCGQSEGWDSAARRWRIELWMQEPDAQLRQVWQWRDNGGVGATLELGTRDKILAAKVAKGIDAVERHAPAIRKRTVYTKGLITPTGELDFKITPAALIAAGAPAHFVARASQWLKIDEQIDIAANGTQTLLEAWQGGEDFDDDFYGASRWEYGSI